MSETIPAILMTPSAGASLSEQWMADGRRAASLDLIRTLSSFDAIGPVYALAAEERDRAAFKAAGAEILEQRELTFHFGRVLAGIVQQGGFDRLAYFGGASAPLLHESILMQAVGILAQARIPSAVVNNLHSTDWAILNSAQTLLDLTDRLPADNPLGWILEHEAGFDVHALEPSGATRVDLDTPADLVLLTGHPRLGEELTAFLENVPGALKHRIEALRKVISTPGSTLIVIGRSSADAWRQLERGTQIWVRMFVEERGMSASGRLQRGEVRSLIANWLENLGPEAFVEELSSLGDAVLWDTRVWMAHRGKYPTAAVRFAADLGWVDHIDDAVLRRLTSAVNQAAIPIITGGHGVVSGGVYALVEGMAGG
jgi:hypothetical protein